MAPSMRLAQRVVGHQNDDDERLGLNNICRMDEVDQLALACTLRCAIIRVLLIFLRKQGAGYGHKAEQGF